MGKKKAKAFSAGSSYHVVLCIEDEVDLQSSDLFVDNLEGAQKLFVKKIKELNPDVVQGDIEDALDEGWYKWNNGVVLYTEPYNVHTGA
jgi:hypothetical protein